MTDDSATDRDPTSPPPETAPARGEDGTRGSIPTPGPDVASTSATTGFPAEPGAAPSTPEGTSRAAGAEPGTEPATEPTPGPGTEPAVVGTVPVRAGRGPAGVAGYVGAAILGIVVGAAGLGLATGGLGGAASPSPSPSASPTPAPAAAGNTIGRPDAPVTIEVWADYQCPYCRLEDLLFGGGVEREYVLPGIARIVYRDFAFLGQESIDAAVAARCAGRQEPAAQLRYHDALYTFQQGENQGRFVRDNLLQIATIAGVPDVDAFGSCLDDPTVAQAVADETTAGRNVGITSTPTLRLEGPGGERVLRGFNQEWPPLRDAIEAVLVPASPDASGSPDAGASPASPAGSSGDPTPAPTAGASASPAP